MKKIKILLSILAVPIGVLMFVYAGVDDSPGGQLLGVIVVVSGIVSLVKSKKKDQKRLKISQINLMKERKN